MFKTAKNAISRKKKFFLIHLISHVFLPGLFQIFWPAVLLFWDVYIMLLNQIYFKFFLHFIYLSEKQPVTDRLLAQLIIFHFPYYYKLGKFSCHTLNKCLRQTYKQACTISKIL